MQLFSCISESIEVMDW